ncbi:MAG: DUF2341 domain-containing protein [Chloroflexota bacterium]|nr:DUF2341 domain-containing protein [Chloroflexota bacterium]
MDTEWGYRNPVTVTCPCDQPATDYQVQVLLDSINFDFTKALPDGSDLRVTDVDGVTQIPFWIEVWDSSGEQASIWIKVPELPLSGTAIYLYYGNPTPPPPPVVEMPPIGPWTRASGNPIVPLGGPTNGRSLLAENIVYDDVSGHYWMVHANYNDGGVGLVWSDTPTDPTSWNWHGTVVTSANAPHLIKEGSTWHIFYADRGHGGSPLSHIRGNIRHNIGHLYLYRHRTHGHRTLGDSPCRRALRFPAQ